jgi:hypothetical protein
MVLVVLTAIVLPVSMLAVWATRTVLNTDRFSATVDDVISDPAVLSAVSSRITDDAFAAVNGSTVLEQLPPILQRAVPIIQGALRGRVEQRVNDVLASDTGQQLLTNAVKRAHTAALRLLEGDGILSSSAFDVQDGVVTLDALPLIRQVLISLQNDGVIPASVPIPAEGEPPGKIATAIGSVLPADFGQIVVYRTDAADLDTTLDQAQRVLVLTKRGVVVAVVVALALAVAAVLVAVDRRRAIYRVGLGVTIGTVVVLVAARRAAAAVPNAATTPAGHAVAEALTDSLRSSLTRALFIVALLAAIVAVVARTSDTLVAWAATHTDIARIIVIGTALVFLLVLGIGWGALILAIIIAAGGLLAINYATRHRTAPPLPQTTD